MPKNIVADIDDAPDSDGWVTKGQYNAITDTMHLHKDYLDKLSDAGAGKLLMKRLMQQRKL